MYIWIWLWKISDQTGSNNISQTEKCTTKWDKKMKQKRQQTTYNFHDEKCEKAVSSVVNG